MALSINKLNNIQIEMKRLHARIQQLRHVVEAEMILRKKTSTGYIIKGDTGLTKFPREQGAVRRASLDLSRTLSDIRKAD